MLDELYPAGRVVLREVGLRDGLQLAKGYPSTDEKRHWVRAEHAAGVRHFEVGSFLPADRAPHFADVREVIAAVEALPGAFGLALALNQRGATDALATPVDEITCVLSATEANNMANTRRTREQSLGEIATVIEARRASDSGALIDVGIAMAFGCSLSGSVDPDDVVRLAEQCLELGADLVGLADTVGYGNPKQVAALTKRMVALCGDRPFVIHLHDTRGLGIANAAAAMAEGARVFDASLGGLGGCPFAPGATGNVVMEDLAFLCAETGFDTGIDLEKLIAVRLLVEAALPDDPLHGGIAKAGLPKVA
jgi:hydroxymethylglutaryl-CoA lyase